MNIKNISLEIKAIIGIIVFTLFIVGLDRYLLSQNITNQFVESKKSKNDLLLNTISPIISLNISLGLSSSNNEYLEQITEQNKDLQLLQIIDKQGILIYNYGEKCTEQNETQHKNNLNYVTKELIDSITDEKLGTIHMHFSDSEFEIMQMKNRVTTIQIFITSFVLLLIFIFMTRKEFKHIRELSKNVLSYDPKLNNFHLTKLDRKDEVGIIHNAIVSMVEKINSHAKLLDEANNSLEQKVQERTQELEEANKKLLQLSITDPLTNIANRRHFENYFSNIWTLAKRSNAKVSVIMCDIDHFKDINDTFGHAVGDYVLIEVAKTMKNTLKRESDLVARYGGEEFIIALYDTNIYEATMLCENIQNALTQLNLFENQPQKHKPVTLSFGISSTVPQIADEAEELIKIADKCLYEAKNRGRDCIITPSEFIQIS